MLSSNGVNFLGLTNKQPVETKMAKIQKDWEKSEKFFKEFDGLEKECSNAEALKKLNDTGYKAFCQIKGEQKEIQPDFWQPGKPLEKGPELNKGLELGYYKLTKVVEKLESIGDDGTKAKVEETVWDSSDLSYDEIEAMIQDVEAKYEEIMAQKTAIIGREIYDDNTDEALLMKEFQEVERFAGVIQQKPEHKGLKLFS